MTKRKPKPVEFLDITCPKCGMNIAAAAFSEVLHDIAGPAYLVCPNVNCKVDLVVNCLFIVEIEK